jgi:anaerobic selenocysteine-containing dehydrogenase
VPDADHPFSLTTGRSLYQFHTRTKTGRAPELNAAAPEPWVEINPQDAEALGIATGDLARIDSARGSIQVVARVSDIRPGTAFVPFHYGYWDIGDTAGPGDMFPRAANELTLTAWDPVSKQPLYKVAAVSITKVSEASEA